MIGCLNVWTGRATDVERTHGQLRAGFADGLRGDNADGFAELDQLAGGQVASVALCADAAPAFAREHRANLELLDADALQLHRDLLVDELVCFDDFFPFIHWVGDRFAAYAANDALAEIDDFFVAFVNGAHDDAVDRAAIVLA